MPAKKKDGAPPTKRAKTAVMGKYGLKAPLVSGVAPNHRRRRIVCSVREALIKIDPEGAALAGIDVPPDAEQIEEQIITL